MKALVVLSGGTDSAVALQLATIRDEEINGERLKGEVIRVEAIAFEYGQKMLRELKAGADVAKAMEVPFTVLSLTSSVFSGALIRGEKDAPFGKLREIRPQGTSPTEIPFRNAIFLSAAVGYAIDHGCSEVWHGIHAEHGTEWAYPDNSPEFLGAFAAATWIGSAHRVRLISPFEWMTKTEVIKIGLELETPFELTYSCYTGTFPSCGECIACQARIEAFAANHAVDPIHYMEGNERIRHGNLSYPLGGEPTTLREDR